MSLRQISMCGLVCGALLNPISAMAEDTESLGLHLELNKVEETGTACRLTFVAQNQMGAEVERAVFETVIFNRSGGVLLLSLFDFRELPSDTLRVRQFDVPNTPCDDLGRVLINGANTCIMKGTESDGCGAALRVHSRIEVELLG